MRRAAEFLFVNLFFLAIAAIMGASTFLVWSAVQALGLSRDAEEWLVLPAGAVALVATYYTSRALYRALNRVVNPRR